MWVVETLNALVDAELERMPHDIQARMQRIAQLIQSQGLERVREPHVRHLEGRLWEMRLSGRDGIARAIYVTAAGQRLIVVRAFTKKTQKTPRRELDLAHKRAEEIDQ
jgi:phage-related protein